MTRTDKEKLEAIRIHIEYIESQEDVWQSPFKYVLYLKINQIREILDEED